VREIVVPALRGQPGNTYFLTYFIGDGAEQRRESFGRFRPWKSLTSCKRSNAMHLRSYCVIIPVPVVDRGDRRTLKRFWVFVFTCTHLSVVFLRREKGDSKNEERKVCKWRKSSCLVSCIHFCLIVRL
jgi:hypothetical protein